MNTAPVVGEDDFKTIRAGRETHKFLLDTLPLNDQQVVLVGCNCREEAIKEDVLRHQQQWGRVVHLVLFPGGPLPLASGFYKESEINRNILVDRINEAIDEVKAERIILLGEWPCSISSSMEWAVEHVFRRLVAGKRHTHLEFPKYDVELQFHMSYETCMRTYVVDSNHRLLSPTVLPRV